MAQIVKLRRSSVSGQKPTNENLQLGELALNTTDGKVFLAKSGSLGPSVEEVLVTNTVNTGSLTLSGSLNLIGNESVTGSLSVSQLSGSGTRMVVANSSGTLSSQAIPTFTETDTLASITARGNTTTTRIFSEGADRLAFIDGPNNVIGFSYVGGNGGPYAFPYSAYMHTDGSNSLFFSTGVEKALTIAGNGNILMGTNTNAGYKLDVNGPSRFAGTSFTVSSGEAYVGTLGLTAGSVGTYGNAIYSTGGDGTVVVAVSYGGMVIQPWFGANGTVSLLNLANPRSVLKIGGGFSNGNDNNLSGNALWLTPTYNFNQEDKVGTIVRGVYYNPTLTNLLNTTHYAFEATSGLVKLGNLAGTGTRMVVADSTGTLTTQEIASGGEGTEGKTAKLEQTVASTGWTFNHYLGEQYPAITIFDDNDKVIIPLSVTATDSNSLYITFNTPVSGVATATVGGGLPSISGSYNGRVLSIEDDAPVWKTGMISGSLQISNLGFSTTGSNTFVGNQTISGSLTISDSIVKQTTATNVSTNTSISLLPTGSYNAGFFDYVIKSGSNLRAGNIMSVWDGSTVNFTETTTNDIGNTSGVTLSVSESNGNISLTTQISSGAWTIKVLSRGI